MSENRRVKPNYNNPTYNQQYDNGNKQYENSFGEPSYLPVSYEYDRKYTNSFYEENDSSAAGSFLFGALGRWSNWRGNCSFPSTEIRQ